WALDFPFMKRYSKEFLAKYPHLKGKDLERTKMACLKFRHTPVSIMNFVEGTRYTPQEAKHSAFSHLLTPKAGGIAFVLSSMGQCLNKILDVTIVYPGGVPSFWSFISGRTRKIIVDFQLLDAGWQLKGDYFNDPDFRERFCQWLNQLWQEKDQKIDRMLS
ncbi:MAG TPA: acetyltransferase, partial [Desulfotignum sp.]|nr:acetyltransferase [Desulfotignum sp.]